MAEGFDIIPSKKLKKDSFEPSECIFSSLSFCPVQFNQETPASHSQADSAKLTSLFHACQMRNDEIGNEILKNKGEIINGTIVLHYHRPCRSA